jgi:hypothetical protein
MSFPRAANYYGPPQRMQYDPGMGMDELCDALNLGLFIGVLAGSDASPSISSAIIGFLQPGNDAYAGTVQNELRRTIWIEQYKNDDGSRVSGGSQDNSTGIQKAFDYARTMNNPTIKSGAGVFLIGAEVSCDFPCTIDLGGTFRPHGTYAEYLFKFTGTVPGNEDTNTDNLAYDSYWRDRITFKQPLRIDGYKSDGSARQSKAAKFKNIDHGHIMVDARWCVAKAIHISGCRETDFYLRILRSGGANATTTDAPLYIFDDSDTVDANNNNRFWGLNVSYPNGAIVYIGKHASASGTPRRMEFHGAQLHHLDATISGSTWAYQDTTLQNGTSIDIALATDIRFFGGNLRQAGATGTLVKLGDSAAGTAADRVKFIGTDLSGDANSASMQLFDLQSVTTRIGLIDCALTVVGSGLKFSAGSDTAKIFMALDGSYLDISGANAVVRVTPTLSSSPALSSGVTGDAARRFVVLASGEIQLGGGSGAVDVALRRASADLLELATGDGFVPQTTGQLLGSNAKQWRVYHEVAATASLPAAASSMDGGILIEDAGAGDRNIILYAGGERFRIDGGAPF